MGKNNNNELKEIALKWKKSEYSNCDLLNLLDNFDINPTIKEYSRAVRNGYASYGIRLIYLMIAHYYFEKHKNNVSDFESLKLLNKGLQMFVDLNEFSTIGETLKDITVEEKEAYLADKERFKELVNFHYLKFLVLTSNNKIYTQPLAMISYMKGFLIALKSNYTDILLDFYPLDETGRTFTSFNNGQAFEAAIINELKPLLDKSSYLFEHAFDKTLVVYSYLVYFTTRKRNVDFYYNRLAEQYFNAFEHLFKIKYIDEVEDDYRYAKFYLAQSVGACAAKDNEQSLHFAASAKEKADNLLYPDFNKAFDIIDKLNNLSSNGLIDYDIEDFIEWLTDAYQKSSTQNLTYDTAVSVIRALNNSFANGYACHELEEENASYLDLYIAPIYMEAFEVIKNTNKKFMELDYMVTAAYLMVVIGSIDSDKDLLRNGFDELIKVYKIDELVNLNPRFTKNINKKILSNMDSKDIFVRVVKLYMDNKK